MLNNSYQLFSKTSFVTGAAGQIGSALVSELLNRGSNVVAIDNCIQQLEKQAESSKWPQDKLEMRKCDIRDLGEVETAFTAGERRFGQIGTLVNNAGASTFERFLERPEVSIDLMMDVNLKGTIFCTNSFAKRSISHGNGGVIVNIASHYGLISPDPRIYGDSDRRNSETYGATKAGIIQLSRYYAIHLVQNNIRVNSVSPGGVRNPITPQSVAFQTKYSSRCPMKRMGEISEIVNPILFLLSKDASYINGHNLVIDGGMSAW